MNNNDTAGGRNRLIKLAFGLGALVCLLTGLLIYLFAPAFGLDEETAQIVAVAFLAAGAADYLLLRFWDRIVRRRTQ